MNKRSKRRIEENEFLRETRNIEREFQDEEKELFGFECDRALKKCFDGFLSQTDFPIILANLEEKSSEGAKFQTSKPLVLRTLDTHKRR